MTTSWERREIRLGDETVSYELERKRVKNINIRLRPETGLIVSAAYGAPIQEIEAAVRKHGTKILEMLHRYAADQTKQPAQYPCFYTDGEPVLYLGKYCTLSVARSQTEGVQQEGDRLLLLTRDPEDAARRKQIFDQWWNARCAQYIRNLCRAVYPIYEARKVPFPEIRFRRMVAQWGNCRPNQKILTFNTRLLAAPVRCMEYVVIHEFTHFLYPHHDDAFYGFIAEELPDWRQLQDFLQKQVQTRNIGEPPRTFDNMSKKEGQPL